jgi:hypothetical protein
MKNDQPNSKMTSSGNNNSGRILVKLSDYQSAVGLTSKATELFNSVLKTKAFYNQWKNSKFGVLQLINFNEDKDIYERSVVSVLLYPISLHYC